jgi:uncharacterized protein DUF6894
MKRYYFDMREGDRIARDEEGMELSSLAKVQEEAARTLADIARDLVRQYHDKNAHRLSVEVRDDEGSVLVVMCTFDAKRQRRLE